MIPFVFRFLFCYLLFCSLTSAKVIQIHLDQYDNE
jgi:hypothetical protein